MGIIGQKLKAEETLNTVWKRNLCLDHRRVAGTEYTKPRKSRTESNSQSNWAGNDEIVCTARHAGGNQGDMDITGDATSTVCKYFINDFWLIDERLVTTTQIDLQNKAKALQRLIRNCQRFSKNLTSGVLIYQISSPCLFSLETPLSDYLYLAMMIDMLPSQSIFTLGKFRVRYAIHSYSSLVRLS